MAMDIKDCLGQRLLVSVDDGLPVMTCVAAYTPKGQYVWLRAVSGFDEEVGWRHVSSVRVLECFGSSDLTLAELTQSLVQQGQEVALAQAVVR